MNGIIVSGCSGVGKSTIIRNLLELHPEYVYSVSYTTRSPRKGEIDGRDYVFVSKEEFEQKKKEHFFIEYEEVYGAYYGTPRKVLEAAERSDGVVIFELDTRGALNLKSKFPQFSTVAVVPPSIKTMTKRLNARGAGSKEDADARLKSILEELHRLKTFEYCLINDDLGEAVRNLETIVNAQRFRAEFAGSIFDKLLRESEVIKL